MLEKIIFAKSCRKPFPFPKLLVRDVDTYKYMLRKNLNKKTSLAAQRKYREDTFPVAGYNHLMECGECLNIADITHIYIYI